MNPVLALIIANVIWGAASPIFKYALTDIPPFTLAFIRFFFASFLFLPFVWNYNFRKLAGRDWFDILVGSFFAISINVAFFFLGLQKTESITAPIIATSGPVFLFILSVIFLHEVPKMKVFYGMILSLLGVMVVVFAPLLEAQVQGTNALEGNIYLIISTAGSVIGPLLMKRVLSKVSIPVITFVGFLFSSATFLPFALPELSHWNLSMLNSAGMFGIFFGVLFSSGLAYYLYNSGMAGVQAQEIGLFSYVDPLIAVIIAAPLLGEYPDRYFTIGAFLVFAGIFYAEQRLHWHPFYRLRKVYDYILIGS